MSDEQQGAAQTGPQGRSAKIVHRHDARMVADHLRMEPVGEHHSKLMRWYLDAKERGVMHEIMPDFHRLQIERWIYDRSLAIMGSPADSVTSDARMSASVRRALDFGVIERRVWQDARYKTAGVSGQEDVRIDLCDPVGIGLTDGEAQAIRKLDASFDLVICSEVLEHVAHPFAAVETLRLLLKPGGRLLVTSPFLWSDHSTEDYPDYWRFTEGAWRLLMKHAGLEIVTMQPCAWSYYGGHAYDWIRMFEGWGFRPQVEGHTGYMVEARKP
jgi:SAM-dependent methyltransferase